MGANLSSQKTNGSRHGQSRRRGRRAISEINVTPFVDVMLVLLIVFMVTAPMLTAGVAVDLPRSQASQIESQDDNPLEVTVKENGEIFIGETKVEEDRLIPLLMVTVQNDMDKRIYVRADENLDYGRVMEILGSINSAGLRKVALVSKQQ